MRYLTAILFVLLGIIPAAAQTNDSGWPVFQGSPDLSGRTDYELPPSPSLLWSVSTGVRSKSSPVLSNGLIFFGNDKGTLTAVTTGGRIKWRYDTESTIEAPPLFHNGKVIFGAHDGILRAVDASTGKLVWQYAAGNQITGSANVWTSGKMSGIVVGSYDYYLHCVEPETGKLIWKAESDNYINGTPSFYGNKVVFGGCDGIIRVIDPPTGKQRDTVDIGVYMAASPSLASDAAFFGDYDGTLYSVNLTTKRINWKAK